ncbi:MAG: PilZ domain-containing protein [Hyphomicrobiales bacterium]
MDDKRKAQRMRHLKEGRIYFNGKKSMMSYILRGASATGARLTVDKPYLPPAEFEFVMLESPAWPVRKVWVKQYEMGIEFLA